MKTTLFILALSISGAVFAKGQSCESDAKYYAASKANVQESELTFDPGASSDDNYVFNDHDGNQVEESCSPSHDGGSCDCQ